MYKLCLLCTCNLLQRFRIYHILFLMRLLNHILNAVPDLGILLPAFHIEKNSQKRQHNESNMIERDTQRKSMKISKDYKAYKSPQLLYLPCIELFTLLTLVYLIFCVTNLQNKSKKTNFSEFKFSTQFHLYETLFYISNVWYRKLLMVKL